MENENKIVQFFNSKGKSVEEITGMNAEELELQPEEVKFWWQSKLNPFYKNPNVETDKYQD